MLLGPLPCLNWSATCRKKPLLCISCQFAYHWLPGRALASLQGDVPPGVVLFVSRLLPPRTAVAGSA
jgi:hypothetical protein